MRTFPDQNFEIINLGLTAVNSYTLLDFAQAVAREQPDAVLIYAGHNEYYGALGVGSSSQLGFSQHPKGVRLMLQLRKIRLVQLAHQIVTSFAPTQSPETDPSENLMKRMAADQSIAKNSPAYQQGIRQFQRNLDDLLEILSQEEIPVFIANLVSNERHQKPLVSQFRGHTQTSIPEIDQLIRRAKSTQAIEAARKLLCEDSTYALAHYYLANLLYNQQDFNQAKKHYWLAKEHDLLRFRAPEQMNQIIETLSKTHPHCFLVDMQAAFKAQSPQGIIGKELMLEHLHPNYQGYYLMAETFANALKTQRMIADPWPAMPSRADFWAEMPFTRVDALYAQYKTWMLKERWPFNEPMPRETTRKKSFEEKLAGGLAVRTIEWGDGLHALYDHYMKQQQYEKALKVIESLLLEFPYDLRLYTRVLSLAQRIKNYELAFLYARKAFDKNPSLEWARLAFINGLRLDETARSLPYLQYAVQGGQKELIPMLNMTGMIDQMKQKLLAQGQDLATIRQIAQYYMQIGNFRAAGKYVNMALALAPKDETSLALKTQLR
ncbi:MAG: hypothetical protein HC880_05315 [Bacteroidia bacterium]|nr:hypothetical protein [Bacteroidia bacterium]